MRARSRAQERLGDAIRLRVDKSVLFPLDTLAISVESTDGSELTAKDVEVQVESIVSMLGDSRPRRRRYRSIPKKSVDKHTVGFEWVLKKQDFVHPSYSGTIFTTAYVVEAKHNASGEILKIPLEVSK